ncbi:MAG TPA: hypothetical protein VEV17_22990 [Bryobacteraceae bacterium]|nr:hypothetical protein [Bryobacteraceae bacterium]
MAVRVARLAVLVLLVAVLTSPTDLSSCGPFLTTAVFTFSRQPDDPGAAPMGILLPTFYRSNLIVAYRRLIGVGFDDAARKAFFPPPPKPEHPPNGVPAWGVLLPTATQDWLAARKKVPGAPEPPKIDVYRRDRTPGDYDEYVNCPDDAFRTASTTLGDRLARYGAANPELLDWLRGQDDVFANCSGSPVNPNPPPEGGSAWLQADRAYQIAAASFYAGDFDRAEAEFRAIAADQRSPWRTSAPYLVARCSIRRATLSHQPEAMMQAQTQLENILKNDSLKPVHAAAASLLAFVNARLDPDRRLHELSQSILAKTPSPSLAQDFTDYLFLFYKLDWSKLNQPDDLTDWLSTFLVSPAPADHALERWRATQSLPWLVAALTRSQAGAPPDLLQAADQVQSDSPAYATVAFQTVRLLENSKESADARRRLDAILAERTKYPPSTANLFLAERMRVAESWEAFLRYALRVPVGSGYDYESEAPIDPAADPQLKAFAGGRPIFDMDATTVLNRQIPLHLVADAVERGALPAPLRSVVARAAWARAVLLDDDAVAEPLARLLQKIEPAWNQPLGDYLKAADRSAKRFSAAYLMLRNPGARPYLDPGFGRLTPIGKLDSFRDNWWCAPAKGEQGAGSPGMGWAWSPPMSLLYGASRPQATFLTEADQAQAAQEWAKLAGFPGAPSFLSAVALEYVKAHPNDPRAPEALALAVRSTRYGCADADTGKQSKAAFQLLHARYASTDWAKKTRYWYSLH